MLALTHLGAEQVTVEPLATAHPLRCSGTSRPGSWDEQKLARSMVFAHFHEARTLPWPNGSGGVTGSWWANSCRGRGPLAAPFS